MNVITMCTVLFTGGKMDRRYKCNDCNDTGFVWTRRADGTKEMVLCHCHPLVQSGKAKAWEGESAIIRRLKRKKKGEYEIGD